jgi:hypothetical protein
MSRRWRSPVRARAGLRRLPPLPQMPTVGPLSPGAALIIAAVAFAVGWAVASVKEARRRKEALVGNLVAVKAGTAPPAELDPEMSDSDGEPEIRISASDNALWLNTSLFPR